MELEEVNFERNEKPGVEESHHESNKEKKEENPQRLPDKFDQRVENAGDSLVNLAKRLEWVKSASHVFFSFETKSQMSQSLVCDWLISVFTF